jgi:hypothetical protein
MTSFIYQSGRRQTTPADGVAKARSRGCGERQKLGLAANQGSHPGACGAPAARFRRAYQLERVVSEGTEV